MAVNTLPTASSLNVAGAALRSAALAHRRVTFFIRRGKRERVEGLFRALWRRNSDQRSTPRKANAVNKAAPSGSALLQNFSLAATPFVALRTRRRGARQTVKVTFLPQARGQRKALISLASTRSTGGAASAPFGARLRRQLEGLLRPEGRPRGLTVSSTATGAAALRDRRDDIHRQARRAIPMNPLWRGRGRK